MPRSTPRFRVMLLCALLALVGGCTADGAVGTAAQASNTAAQAPNTAAQAPTGLKLVVDDQFTGTSLNTRLWSTCHWWAPDGCTIASNDELQWYLAEQVAVKKGRLHLTASAAGDPQGPDSVPYLSGMVTTGPQESDGPAKFSFTYGRVEVAFNAPSGRGLWPAIWMLPASTQSRPEIDLFEATGQRPGRWVFHLHPKDRNRDSRKGVLNKKRLGSGTHTIGLDWRPGALTWSVDGQPAWTVTGRDVPSEAMYLVINLAVGGIFPGPPDRSTQFPATFEIDRVRIWKLRAGS